MKKIVLVLAAFGLAQSLFAQLTPPRFMKFIEGNSRIMGGGYQYEIKSWRMHYLGVDSVYAAWNQMSPAIGEVPSENNPDKRVTIASFYIAEKEISNREYREFLKDSLLSPEEKVHMEKSLQIAVKKKEQQRPCWNIVFEKAAARQLLPDTLCWVDDFEIGYNDPMAEYYLWHPAFENYPVVGVSWNQANAYCEWLTRSVNRERKAKGLGPLPAFRLPTEMEWEYAAGGLQKVEEGQTEFNNLFPWEGRRPVDSKGFYIANIKTGHGDYIGDNFEYTAPVDAFPPNTFGLYNMGGNASEWVMDVFRFNGGPLPEPIPAALVFNDSDLVHPRVVKGGSWADYYYATMCGSRTFQRQDQGSSRVGFRVAMTKVGEPEEK